MARDSSDRSLIAGQRLKILRKMAYDKPFSQEKLVSEPRWNNVDVFDAKTISGYENKGVPLEKLNGVAAVEFQII